MTVHFVEDYKELTGETTAAATKRFKAENADAKVISGPPVSEAKSSDADVETK